ncbi:hypothetical protein ACQJBY_022875 [Aegilops geniculata]
MGRMADPHAAYIELPPPPLAPRPRLPTLLPLQHPGVVLVASQLRSLRLPCSTPPPCPLNFIMSGMPADDASAQMRLEGEVSGEKVEDTQDENEGSGMPSPQEEEAAIKKKYGGKCPKNRHLYRRTMSGLSLILLIGL